MHVRTLACICDGCTLALRPLVKFHCCHLPLPLLLHHSCRLIACCARYLCLRPPCRGQPRQQGVTGRPQPCLRISTSHTDDAWRDIMVACSSSSRPGTLIGQACPAINIADTLMPSSRRTATCSPNQRASWSTACANFISLGRDGIRRELFMPSSTAILVITCR